MAGYRTKDNVKINFTAGYIEESAYKAFDDALKKIKCSEYADRNENLSVWHEAETILNQLIINVSNSKNFCDRARSCGITVDALASDVFLRLFKRMSFINVSSPAGLNLYIQKVIKDVLADTYHNEYVKDKESLDEPLTPGETATKGDMIPDSNPTIEEEIECKERVLLIYENAVHMVLSLNSAPYVILGFCHGSLLYGLNYKKQDSAESDGVKKNKSPAKINFDISSVAKKIAGKTLGILKEDFRIQAAKFYPPIDSAYFLVFDKSLAKICDTNHYLTNLSNDSEVASAPAKTSSI